MPPEPGLTLVFETHATSLDNEAGLASGWFDVELSAAGRRQARTLRDRRGEEPFATVFCSDLERSFRTAEIAFNDRSCPIIRDARLRECDYGDLTRRPTVEIDSQRVRRLVEPFPNGESYQQVADRVSGFLAEVRQRFDSGTILVIGHRATFYSFEHLLKRVTLHEAVSSPWTWQPGWTYYLRSQEPAWQRSTS